MRQLLFTVMLMLLFMTGMGSNSDDNKKIEKRNAMANFLLKDLENAHITPINHKNLYSKLNTETKIDAKENSQSVLQPIKFSKQEVENKKVVELKPSEYHTKTRERFFKYMQELNQLTFLELSQKLEELHKKLFRYEFPRRNPKKYLEFFKEEDLQCLISEIDPTITDVRTLNEDEQADYLHHWADWIWVFYMNESSDRRWFFNEMKQISEYDLDKYEAGATNATFVIYLAHSFIRSINIYRRCKIPLTSLISDEYVSQYLIRGIRVDQFNIEYSMFPSNFQSYSMNTIGVESVLGFYSREHHMDHKNTVVITMVEYDFAMQQLAQPIAIFDLMHAEYNKDNKVHHHAATETEKEVIFPPFCFFSLKEFELKDIKNKFQREHMVFRMWKLAAAGNGHQSDKFDADIKLLWVTEVDYLPLYDALTDPFFQSERNELEHKERLIHPPKVSIRNNIEYWQTKFPQEIHACIRLFATHEQDITNRTTVEKKERDHMILEFMEYQAFIYDEIKNEMKNNHNESISHEDYNETFQTFKQGLISSEYEETDTKKLLSSIHQFYAKIQQYMEDQSNKKELSRYQIQLHLSFFIHNVIYKKDEWMNYCLQWETKQMLATNDPKQNTLGINKCYSKAVPDSDHGRFVCEYEDHSYSLNTDFPCRRKHLTKKTEEFGRFCKLSSS